MPCDEKVVEFSKLMIDYVPCLIIFKSFVCFLYNDEFIKYLYISYIRNIKRYEC